MKENIKKIIGLIIVIIAIVISSFFTKDYLNKKAERNIEQNQNINAENPGVPVELTEAYVTKVVDGDTIWVKIGNEEQKVRLIGLNCPEYTKEIEPYGKEATEYTTNKLLNTTVYLQKDVSDKDSYDRLLRYVWTSNIDVLTPDNVEDYLYNYEIVRVGLAQSNYYKPDISLQSYLNEAQSNAKNELKGMWE